MRRARSSSSRRLVGALTALFATTLHAAAARAGSEVAPPAPAPGPAGKLTKPPKLVRFVEAGYPESERATKKSASVTLALTISETGAVTEAAVQTSAGKPFDDAALAAARQFVFAPAEIDGKPARVRVLYQYDFVLKVEAPTTARFTGVVKDAASKAPLAGVTVRIEGIQGPAGPAGTEGTASAVTGADGRFEIRDVPPGARSVSLTAPAAAQAGEAFPELRTDERFEAGKQLDETYLVERPPAPVAGAQGEPADDLEIVVVAPPLQKSAVSTEVSADQGRAVAGTQGDVVKVVESLPGVGRAAPGSGQLVVWGAAPGDTRVYVDGVRIPLLYHLGGYRSVLASDQVKSVELVPGGYGAAWGGGLGGLVTVGLRPLEGQGVHGSASLDAVDANASLRAKVTDGVYVAAAGRRTHLDTVLPWFTSAARQRDTGELFPTPRSWDGQVRAGWISSPQARVRARVEAGFLASSDTLVRTVSDPDPALVRSESRSISFQRAFVRYEAESDAGEAYFFVPYAGRDRSSLDSRYGATPTGVEVNADVYGARAGWRGRAAPGFALSLGLDAELVSAEVARTGSIASPAREGDPHVFGQAPSDLVGADTWSSMVASASPYAEGDLALFGGRLRVVPGLRLASYAWSASRRTPRVGATPSLGLFAQQLAWEPRLLLRVDGQDASFKAAVAVVHQAPDPADLSAVFGTPTLGLSRAAQGLVGGTFRLPAGVTVETTAFYVASDGLPVRSVSASPLEAQALVGEGRGRAFGAQILVRRQLAGGVFGWLSWSLSRSERRDHPGDAWRLSDYDQTHVVTALASWEVGRGVTLGARARLSSGFPRTPVASAYYDARRDAWQPLFGATNGERIPAFFQVDLRASKRFALGPDESLELYLDLLNATNRQNPEEIVYARDYAHRAYLTGLPILPVIGARLGW